MPSTPEGTIGSDADVRVLKVVTAALTAVPLIGGLAGVLAGPAAVTGQRRGVDASTDSEFRFLSAAWMTTAPLVWSTLPTAEYRPRQLRIVGAGIIGGGIARLLSWRRHGRPRPLQVAGAALELIGVPVLLAWHTTIVNRTERRAPGAGD